MVKNTFSINSLFNLSFLKSEFCKIFSIVSLFKAVTFEISLIIRSVPKLKSCENFNAEFSKKNIWVLFLSILILKKVFSLFSFINIAPSMKLLKIIFIPKLHFLKIFCRLLKSFLFIKQKDNSWE